MLHHFLTFPIMERASRGGTSQVALHAPSKKSPVAPLVEDILRDAQTRLAPRCPSHHAWHLSDKRASISLASILPYRARGRCFQAGLFWMVLANLQGGTLRLVRVHGVRLVRRRSRCWG